MPPTPPRAPASPTPPALPTAGLARLSTTDWPDHLVATVFLQGCPWRCPYCHNSHLQTLGADTPLTWEGVLAFLRSRQGLLDGVVFSGGEPTLHPALPGAMAEVRALGFAIGLHTAGPAPDALPPLLPLVDWVGFDAKAPFDAYDTVTGRADSGPKARESLRRLLEAQATTHRTLGLEVRTTLHPALIDAAGLDRLAADLANLGVRHWVLQAFRAEGCQDPILCADAGLPLPLLSRARAEAFAKIEQRGM